MCNSNVVNDLKSIITDIIEQFDYGVDDFELKCDELMCSFYVYFLKNKEKTMFEDIIPKHVVVDEKFISNIIKDILNPNSQNYFP